MDTSIPGNTTTGIMDFHNYGYYGFPNYGYNSYYGYGISTTTEGDPYHILMAQEAQDSRNYTPSSRIA